MKKFIKIAKLIFCVALIALILSSSLIVSVHHAHECVKNDCPICQIIGVVKQIFDLAFVLLSLACGLFFAASASLHAGTDYIIKIFNNPIRLKVKLLN